MGRISYLYSRTNWNRPWLWDVGIFLGLINGGVGTQILSHEATPYSYQIAFVLVGFGITVGAFITADRLFSHRLPRIDTATPTFPLVVPFMIVVAFFGSTFVLGSVFAVDTRLHEFLLFIVGNIATLVTIAIVVLYYR